MRSGCGEERRWTPSRTGVEGAKAASKDIKHRLLNFSVLQNFRARGALGERHEKLHDNRYCHGRRDSSRLPVSFLAGARSMAAARSIDVRHGGCRPPLKRTSMTAPVSGLRDISHRLRELEESIAAQRKLIGAERSECNREAARRRLARLLAGLDQVLQECELTRQRPDAGTPVA